jgi:hypothetical protein
METTGTLAVKNRRRRAQSLRRDFETGIRTAWNTT